MAKNYATLLPPPAPDPTKSQMEQILAITPLTAFGPDIFTNASPPWHPPRARGIYGGAVIAYCLAAAQATMPETPKFAPHSFHCYFLLAGQADTPMILHVERVRDGRSFATRTVQARQGGRCIFTMTVSFARMDAGGDGVGGNMVKPPTLEHAHPMPSDVAPPTEAHEAEIEGRTGFPFGNTGIQVYGTGEPHEHTCRTWQRIRGKISGGMGEHLAALAYMSDSAFLSAITRVHVATRREKRVGATAARKLSQSDNGDKYLGWTDKREAVAPEEEDNIDVGMLVSLDHTMYFHNPAKVRADEWMLSDMRTSWAGDGRGLVSQRIYARDGTLLATCVQEGVVRLKKKNDSKPAAETLPAPVPAKL